MEVVKIDASKIINESALHEVFNQAIGFPGYYGRNMSAFVDCLTHLDEEENRIKVRRGEVLVLQLDNIGDLKNNHRELYELLVESIAFVNWRRIDIGLPAILVLSFYQ